MWYAIIAEDVANSLPLRKELRPAHLERMKVLQSDGRVLAAGPHPVQDTETPGDEGFTGSLLVLDFPSLQDAEDWASQDPYALGGVYAKVSIKPFIKVLP